MNKIHARLSAFVLALVMAVLMIPVRALAAPSLEVTQQPQNVEVAYP